jgi:NAD(P)-dependent dehydrogenase (short-subunit alcohol dehydrogenase family)
MSDRTTLVIGAGRGLGRGIATAFAESGAPVVAVARDPSALAELAASTDGIRTQAADAAEAESPGVLLGRYRPANVILVAGARPPIRPLQEQTWETFCANWNADVRITFHWLRELLLDPLPPGGRVVVVSSGAALKGSPLSGGYAGAKATQRFITGYAQDEARRAGQAVTFTAVLPQITPATELGLDAIRAYAQRAGQTVEEYLQALGEPLTAQTAGAALVRLTRMQADRIAPAYKLTATGLQPLT